jgi:hypothetical protein
MAADLIGDHHQAAVDILHPGEVGHDIMRRGGEEHLGRHHELLQAATAPGAAMYEDEDRHWDASNKINVEPLGRCRSIGDAFGPGNESRRANWLSLIRRLISLWRLDA